MIPIDKCLSYLVMDLLLPSYYFPVSLIFLSWIMYKQGITGEGKRKKIKKWQFHNKFDL